MNTFKSAMHARFATLGIAALAGTASAADVFEFPLDGMQEVPANNSLSTGFATLSYDNAAQTFDISVTTNGIPLGDLLGVGPNTSPIHLHLAPAGANGPIVVDLGLVGSFVDQGGGMLTFDAVGVPIGGPQGAIPATDPAANEAALFAGELYLNIHTQPFPGGEIRGQVVPAPASMALLAGGALFARRRRRSS